MAGASIVVDIKAQITGYKEQIENIKNELKKVDPGSQIGKSLNKTLEQADQKLAKLSRNAEQRITSQGQLDRLFDQLHNVSDLMRSLGQGMQSVGLNDVLLTSSEQAKQLGQELKAVQDEMKTKGTNFFEELTKTNPKELQAVFDQLKLDPKKTGIDEFVSALDNAVNEAKQKFKDLTQAQEQARAEAENATKIANLRAQLPSELANTSKVSQTFMRQALGSEKFLTQSQANATSLATEFLNQVRVGLDIDNPEKGLERNGALQEALTKTAAGLSKAKDEASVQKVLNALQAAINQHTQKDVGGAKTISELTGGVDLNEWAEKLTAKAEVDKEFETKIRSLISVLTSQDETMASGNSLSKALENLLDPNATSTFKSRMDEVIKVATEGMKEFNDISKAAGDPTKKQAIFEGITNELEKVKNDLTSLDNMRKSPAYQEIQGIVDKLNDRIAVIEQKLGIENGKNANGVVGGVNDAGKKLLNTIPTIDQSATDQLKQYTTALEDAQRRQQMMGKVEGIAQRWFSVYAAVRMVSKAFRSMKENVTKIDNTITEIAIVTDMSQSDLWRQMPQYTEMARKYGSSIEGVYQVSQLYYQQGLEQADVMALTEQTLKMARISGLDYSDATNYMTNAIRSFKIEMQDAQTVVDVYSALAASSASSTSELANAMSKTASSAAAVGSSFESTSAMLAVMIETTRESPENIGSALKSIISRYGELKENKTGIDEEGEEYSLNKVDTALQSVGISIHDTKGEFRDFDDVIMELSQSWDTIDKNTQRYIATVMAGNRQQSRFLALVSNGERLAELTETAENSEDASTLQVLKTMDSIAYKSQNLQTNLQSLYTDSGIENLYKGILDGANEIVKTFTDMPTLFQLPIPALTSFAMNFVSIANIVLTAVQMLKRKFTAQWETDDLTSIIKKRIQQEELVKGEKLTQQEITKIRQEESAKRQNIDQKEKGTTGKGGKLTKTSKAVLGMQLAGTALSIGAGLISDKGTGNRAAKATLGIAGSALEYAAMGTMIAPGWGTALGAVAGAAMGLWQNISYIFESTSDQAKRLKQEAEDLKVTEQQKDATARNTEKEVANVKKLAEAQYQSAEAREKYREAANKLASDMPELVSYYDAEGNAILNLADAYTQLAAQRREANNAANESADASIKAADKAVEEQKEKYQENVGNFLTKAYDDDKFTGVVKEKWQDLEKLAPNFDFIGHGQQLFNVKWGNAGLPAIMEYANEKSFANTPGLNNLRSLVRTSNAQGIIDLMGDSTTRAKNMELWKQELETITDPFDKALMDFILASLESEMAQLTGLSGDLAQAEAQRESVVHSSAAKKIKNYIADTRTMAEYGPQGEQKNAAKKTLEMFEGLENSSEILTNYLTSLYLSGDYGKTWEEFEQKLSDPENSPLFSMINLLKDIPTTSYEQINNILKDKGRYTQDQLKQKLSTILKNDTLTDAILGVYDHYFENVISPKEFYEQMTQQNANNPQMPFTLIGFKAEQFSGEELSTILDMTDRISSMYKSGSITRADARGFINNYRDLWKISNEAEQKILMHMNDFSATGLENLYTMIDESDEFDSDEQKQEFKEKIAEAYSRIPENLNTVSENYMSKMATAVEDYNKAISSATKGMDYKTASEMATKLKIKPTEEFFDIREGQLYLKDLSLLYDFYFGDTGIAQQTKDKLAENQTNLDNAIEQLSTIQNEFDTLTDEEKQSWANKTGLSVVEISTFFKAFKESGEKNIIEFAKNYYANQILGIEEFGETYLQSAELTRAISSGKLKDIVKAAVSGRAKNAIKGITGQLQTALETGDFTYLIENQDLSDEFKAQLPKLKESYDSARASVFDSLVKSIDSGFTYIEGTEWNQKLLKELDEQGIVKLQTAVNGVAGAVVTGTKQQILQALEQQETTATGADLIEIRKWISTVRKSIYGDTKSGTLQQILNNYKNIDEETYKAFMDQWGDTEGLDKVFTTYDNGSRKADLTKLLEVVSKKTDEIDELTTEKMTETVEQAIDDGITSITNAADYVTKGTTNFSDMSKFITMFNEAIPEANAEIMDLFSYDFDLQSFTLDASMYKSYLTGVKNLLTSLGKDTTLIDGLIENANATLVKAIDMDSFIKAEDQSKNGQAYRKLQKQLTDYYSEAPSSINEQLVKAVEQNQEIGGEYWAKNGVKYYFLGDLLKITETTGLNMDEINQIYDQYQTALAAGLVESDETIWQWYVRTNTNNVNSLVEDTIADLKSGGQLAVNRAKEQAARDHRELTSEEIEQYFYAEVNRLKGYSDSVAELTEGQYVAPGEFKDILRSAGMIDEQGLVTNITNVVEAYKEIYERMNKSGDQTASQLNSVYAKLLTAEEQSDVDAISVMGDAMGMTYDALGTMLGKYGIELKGWLEQNTGIYEKIGNGKVRITDFTKFADQMGWEAGSEEWTNAFKTYNDGLIEANKKVKDSIEGELKGFAELQPGDWLNLTYTAEALKKFAKSEGKDNTKAIASAKQSLQKAREEQAGSEIGKISAELYQLEQEDLFTQLNNKLSKFGATLDNGILKLFDNANMLGIADTLSEYAKMTQEELGDSFYEIADTITSILSGYVESVRNGIKGSLKSSDRGRLISQAADMGISLSDMDFSRTTEGFKLSNKQAINMYQKLKQIDHMQSRLVFDDLKSSLEETNDDFKTTTSLLSYIGQLQRELASNLEIGVDPSSLEDLQNELSLALEINLVNLNTDEADWNFMNQDVIPASFKNAIEYFTGVADATTLLGDAATNGYVEVDQFAALVHHIQEVAMGTGQTLDFLGQSFGPNGTTDFNTVLMGLADIYTIDPKTKKAVVTTEALMSKLGLDLTQGAEGLTETVRLAIAEYVKKNAEQLQHVAEFFNGLGELDEAITNSHEAWSNYLNNDGFDVGKLKKHAGQNAEADKIWRALLKSTKNMYVNGTSLAETLEGTEKVLDTSSREYKAIKAITDLMAADLDWTDPDSYSLIASRFADAGFEGTINLGEVEITVENGGVIMETGTGDEKEVIYNNKRYASRDDAIKAIKKEQNDAVIKQLQEAEKSATSGGGESSIEIKNGQPTKIHVSGNDFEITYDDEIAMAGGMPLAEFLHTKYQEYVEQEKQKASDKGYFSEIAWQVHQGLRVLPTIEQQGGVLTADQQQAFLDAGINNVQQLETFLNDPVRRKNFEAAIGVSLPFEYDDKDHVTKESLDKYGDQVLDMINNSGLTQTISQGVAKAFSEGGASESLSQAIHDGLTKSLKSEGKIEVDAPEIVIKPKSITVDTTGTKNISVSDLIAEEIQTPSTPQPIVKPNQKPDQTKVQQYTDTGTGGAKQAATEGTQGLTVDVTLNVTNPTLDGLITPEPVPVDFVASDKEVAPPENIPPGEGEVNYKTNEVEKLPLQLGKGVVKWSNNVNIPTGLTATGTINWKNNWSKPNTGSNDNGGGENKNQTKSIGNIGLAIGNARAAGTLMGELGPELVVQNGRYFVAGQNGAEFVDLASDAIVFNHLQTERLFKYGMSPDRGRAITNERIAAAFAHGNWNGGEAKAKESTFKTGGRVISNRANELINAGAQFQAGSNAWRADQNLRQGKAEDDTKNAAAGAAEEIKNFIKEFERWFNWLQRIAHLEKEITLEESKRSRYESAMTAMGDEFYSSQKRSLDLLEKQVATQQSLISAQYDYYQSLREQLNAHSEFKTVYTFDENFQPIYTDDYEKIQAIRQVGFDKVTGAPNADIKSVYAQLVAMGYGDALVYDTSGNKIDTSKDGWQATAVQAFYDRMDKQLQEAQKLHDDIMDGQNKIEELEAQRNEIMRAIEQNQITVENKVMKALEESRQREIDELKKERDAIEKSSQKLIDGLNDQLQKEQDMYNQQKDADELATLQRQLAILQRSGGSAAQIADLQNQIADKQKTMYFDTQQKQIDAVEEASKNQLERLDHQIDLMQETLDYQKEYGLLWGEVSDILSGTKENILAFISGNTSEYWNKYTTELNSILRQDEFEIQQYKANQADENGTFTSTTGSISYLQGGTTAITGTGKGGTGSGTGSGTGNNQAQAQKYIRQTYEKYSSINPKDVNITYLYYQMDDGSVGVVSGYSFGPNSYDEDAAWANLEMANDKAKASGRTITHVSSNQSDLPVYRAAQQNENMDANDVMYDEHYVPGQTPTFQYTTADGQVRTRIWRGNQPFTGKAMDNMNEQALLHGGLNNIPFDKYGPNENYSVQGSNGKFYSYKNIRTMARKAYGAEAWDQLKPEQVESIVLGLQSGIQEGMFNDSNLEENARKLAKDAAAGKNIVVVNPNGVTLSQQHTMSDEEDKAWYYSLMMAQNEGEQIPYFVEILKKRYGDKVDTQAAIDNTAVYNDIPKDEREKYKDGLPPIATVDNQGQLTISQDYAQILAYMKQINPSETYENLYDQFVTGIDGFKAKLDSGLDKLANALGMQFTTTNDKTNSELANSSNLIKENAGIYRAEGKAIKEALDANAKSAHDVATDQVNGINNVNNTIFGLGQMVAKSIDDKAARDEQQQMRIANALDLQNQREEERLKKEEEAWANKTIEMTDEADNETWAAETAELIKQTWSGWLTEGSRNAVIEGSRSMADAAAEAAAEAAAAKAAIENEKAKYAQKAIIAAGISDIADFKAENIAKKLGIPIAFAKAKGTLLGELGPEAYVSNGTMHIAGLHGAEFVDLPDDAIVFNHLQTARLLQTGMTSRGTPTTSEEAAAGETRQTYLDTFWQSVNSNSSAIQRANTTNYSIPGLNENSIINNSNNGQTVTIERAEVNLQIEKLANDYDSRRAADQVMEEMLRIASKTSMNNSRGRG